MLRNDNTVFILFLLSYFVINLYNKSIEIEPLFCVQEFYDGGRMDKSRSLLVP